MIFKLTTKSLFLYLLVLTFFFNSAVLAESSIKDEIIKHRFTKLAVLPSSNNLKDDDTFNLVLESVLRSDSGFQKERIQVFLDDVLISSSADFLLESTERTNRVKITFLKSDLVYKTAKPNLLKIKFIDTLNTANVLAEREVPVFFKPREVFDNSPAFAGFFDTQPIVKLKVEALNDDNGTIDSKNLKVSTDKRKFLLSFEHDPNYIPAEFEETFSEKNSILLNNLKVFSVDANGKRTNVSSRFSFKLKANSSHKFANFQTLLTQFTTTGVAFPGIQTLEFIVDVKDYLKKINVFFPEDAKTRSERVIRFNAEPVTLTNLSTDKNTIVFYEDLSTNEFSMQSDIFTIKANYDASALSLISPAAFVFNTKNIERHPISDLANLKLILGQNRKVALDVIYDLEDITVLDGDVNIPLRLIIDKPKGFFVKNPDLMNFTETKALDLPFALIAKNTTGVDNDLRGRLNSSLILKFIDSPRFIEKASAAVKVNRNLENPSLSLKFNYNNSAAASIDPLDLVISLLDSSNNRIASVKLENISNITRKANAVYEKTLTTADLGTNFFTALPSAAKVQLELQRDLDYLNRLNLDSALYPALNEVDSLVVDL